MNIRELLTIGNNKLKSFNIDNPAFEAGLILAHLLKKDRAYLYINGNMEINEFLIGKYYKSINLRLNCTPIQYIIGKQEFMGLEFVVNDSVLIPRADTEVLVEQAINFCKDKSNLKIMDMGTGSGCIAISLAYYLKTASIVATDISEKALKVAELNAEKNKVSDRIEFVKSDLFYDVDSVINKDFDLIVSNPPYIDEYDMKKLKDEVRRFEPNIALFGGNDGLYYYNCILSTFSKYLKNNGRLMLEIGYNQNEKLLELVKKYNLVHLKTLKDLALNDRVVIIEK